MQGITNRYPLLEMGLSREDCGKIISDAGLNPVKSRCYFCPYIGDWAGFKTDHPQAFDKAVEMDRQIRDSTRAGVEHPAYLRRDCRPLDGSRDTPLTELELMMGLGPDAWEDQGFEDECDGMCGL
jgi:hypothetical protein